ncbi:hypothetical protein IFM89_026772 [Coptis chinensis]|uniref:FAR1 domain-containing protein n=1 Tax=Coptis chinensis TaxID=261450 RepID=A0A835IEW3_9MAGN|nr:hypothetical protein IFM89_026772 [Coptis chinensis]
MDEEVEVTDFSPGEEVEEMILYNDGVVPNNEFPSLSVETPNEMLEKLVVPKVGMSYQSLEKAKSYYLEYGKQNGFSACVRSTQKDPKTVMMMSHKMVTPNKRLKLRTVKTMPKAAKILVERFDDLNLPIGRIPALLGGEAMGCTDAISFTFEIFPSPYPTCSWARFMHMSTDVAKYQSQRSRLNISDYSRPPLQFTLIERAQNASSNKKLNSRFFGSTS